MYNIKINKKLHKFNGILIIIKTCMYVPLSVLKRGVHVEYRKQLLASNQFSPGYQFSPPYVIVNTVDFNHAFNSTIYF
jgi:hypothetical protein